MPPKRKPKHSSTPIGFSKRQANDPVDATQKKIKFEIIDVDAAESADQINLVSDEEPKNLVELPSNPNSDIWISASSVHNYMLGDPLLDWITMMKKNKWNNNLGESPSMCKRINPNEIGTNEQSEQIINCANCTTSTTNYTTSTTNYTTNTTNILKTSSEASANFDQQFMEYLMEQGTKFESAVVNFLIDKINFECDVVGDDTWTSAIPNCTWPLTRFVKICLSPADIMGENGYKQTLQEMEKGTLVIYQGVVRNYNDNTHGSPDLIIRSDFLNFLYPNTIPSCKIYKQNWNEKFLPNLQSTPQYKMQSNPRYYYIVADIKFSNLKLRADGTHLLNSGRIPCYKAQILIYNAALAYMQNYTPEFCFMLGRGYTYTSKGREYKSYDCDAKLGMISPFSIDSNYPHRISQAVQWRKELVTHGKTWQVLPEPSRSELYPNMSNKYDYPHHKQKQEIADELEEITLLWNCGITNRKKCHSLGITSWKDPRCTVDTLGVTGEYRRQMIQQMLDLNQQDDPEEAENFIYYGDNYNPYSWWRVLGRNKQGINACIAGKNNIKTHRPEFFIDFENVTSVVDSMEKIPHIGGVNLVYMIGVGWIESSRWNYRCFYANTLTLRGEREMFIEFHDFILKKCERLNTPALYHWGSAEKTLYDTMFNRHPDLSVHYEDLSCNFFDFLQIVKHEPILIKGVFGFSLKNYGKALHKLGLIQTNWEDSCADGMQAMLMAAKCYKSRQSLEENSTFLEIIKYNEIDCKVMYEVINCVR